MKAEPRVQLRLLDLQGVDTALAQLQHRRASLPELGALARLGERANLLRTRTAEITVRATDLDDALGRLERDVETVRTRIARDEQRLVAGGQAKDLEGLQHELTSLARRQTTLEDEELEIMEQREGVEGELDLARRERAELEADHGRLTAARDTAFAEIDEGLAARTGERSAVAGEVPGDLLGLYDRIRAASGGIGAAELTQRRCEGCRIELAGSELSKVRAAAADDVVRCENCRRILVRTERSGL